MNEVTNKKYVPTESEAESLYLKLKSDGEQAGYHINSDNEFVMMLMNGLLTNQQRYGYLSCPCRLADGTIELDRDIICPCDYRDPDLSQYEACYCALYVSEKILSGEHEVQSIPERRLPLEDRQTAVSESVEKNNASGLEAAKSVQLSYPVWRCKVCGYLCARNQPPETCPICKVPKERFERFL